MLLMSLGFGLIARFEMFQSLASWLSANLNPAIIHNMEKYHILKKVHYLSAIEDIEGDYLEFGVYKGSSFTHSVRVYKYLKRQYSQEKRMRFFGFDSFSGFGELNDDEQHPFYSQVDFTSTYREVSKRIGRVAGDVEYQLIPGYFNESLSGGAQQYGISKSCIIFIDSDTYSSASEALEFCLPTIQKGTYIILDDHFSYKGSESKGVARAFNEFVQSGHLTVRKVFSYGMGGSVYVVSDIDDGSAAV